MSIMVVFCKMDDAVRKEEWSVMEYRTSIMCVGARVTAYENTVTMNPF